MTHRSPIEWTDATWNPVTGCDRISPGCQHCYALTLAKRLKAMGQPKYQTDAGHPPPGPASASPSTPRPSASRSAVASRGGSSSARWPIFLSGLEPGASPSLLGTGSDSCLRPALHLTRTSGGEQQLGP